MKHFFLENVEWKYEVAEKGNCSPHRRHPGLFIELFNNLLLTSQQLPQGLQAGHCPGS